MEWQQASDAECQLYHVQESTSSQFNYKFPAASLCANTKTLRCKSASPLISNPQASSPRDGSLRGSQLQRDFRFAAGLVYTRTGGCMSPSRVLSCVKLFGARSRLRMCDGRRSGDACALWDACMPWTGSISCMRTAAYSGVICVCRYSARFNLHHLRLSVSAVVHQQT